MKIEERFYSSEGDRVLCKLCPQACKLKSGQKGVCRVRINEEGKLYSTNYGQLAALALDPIEKKPLSRFYPGSNILSVGALGCNLKCSFCQNYNIAHYDRETRYVSPEDLVEMAKQYEKSHANIGIAFTYSEPLMNYQYVLDCSKLLKEKGLKSVLVTNGYVNEDPLTELLPFVDAMNIDVKGYTSEFYQKYCHGSLKSVLRTVELAARQCHVEVTTLLITELNDSPEEIEELAKWLASIDKKIPLHLSRYFPSYKMTLPPTSLETIKGCYHVAKEHLEYVYVGNCPELSEELS